MATLETALLAALDTGPTGTTLRDGRAVETPDARPSAFGELLTWRCGADAREERPLSLADAESAARALRGALLRFADDPPPAVLSGHEPDGRRLERPHTAFLALPGFDGLDATTGDSPATVGALAISLPRDIAEADRQAILLAAARFEASGARLVFGRLGAVRLARLAGADADRSPALARLTGASRHWVSLTPVALPRNPGNLFAADPTRAARARHEAEQTIADACSHSGLPRPAQVRLLRRSPFPTIPPAAAFAPYPRVGSGAKRVCVHAALRFDEPVAGPVLVGAGRYFGVGACCRYEPQP
jgi:CRISPR-associated protein Csb2